MPLCILALGAAIMGTLVVPCAVASYRSLHESGAAPWAVYDFAGSYPTPGALLTELSAGRPPAPPAAGDAVLVELVYQEGGPGPVLTHAIRMSALIWATGRFVSSNRLRLCPVAGDTIAGVAAGNASASVCALSLVVDGREEQRVEDGSRLPFEIGYGLPVLPAHGAARAGPALYPFDRYGAEAGVQLLLERRLSQAEAEGAGKTVVLERVPWGLLAEQPSMALDVAHAFSAARGGGDGGRDVTGGGELHLTIDIRRSAFVRAFAVGVGSLMWMAALSALVISLDHAVARPREPQLAAVTMCVMLMFGLPKMRDLLPGVPPLGVMFDALCYFWTMPLSALAAVVGATAWLAFTNGKRWQPPQPPQPPPALEHPSKDVDAVAPAAAMPGSAAGCAHVSRV